MGDVYVGGFAVATAKEVETRKIVIKNKEVKLCTMLSRKTGKR